MRYFTIVFILAMILSCNSKQRDTTAATVNKTEITTYYLIRHAEKDRSDTTNTNPNLNEAGVARAKRWADYFEDIPLDQIFSTNYHRTQQTAAYTASKKNISVQSYNPANLYNEDFQNLTKGKSVLIVGHSNTTPQFVNAILGESKYTDIDDSENGMLYKVTIADDEKKVKIKKVD